MNITTKKENSTLTLQVEGRIDTVTAPALEAELKKYMDGITELIFDFGGVEYISSAGLRVLLCAQKLMNKQGRMVVKNANEAVMDVFEVTGFSDILNIEAAQ